MLQTLRDWLTTQGLDSHYVSLVAAVLAGIGMILLSMVVNLIAKRIILRVLNQVIQRTRVTWDDAYLKRDVFTRLSHFAPALVIHATAGLAFGEYPAFASMVQTGARIYMVVVGFLVFDAFLNASLDVYERYPISKRVPLKVFFQVAKVVALFVGVIFILASLLGRSPLVFFSGLGAFTAVLILVFKDSILGFVAGIQLMSNNMVQVGDWIEMPKYGADGDVVDVSLTTIKIQNFDKTISTVPTYALISDSFRNWRGMQESEGRRIKRAVILDMTSIRFCDREMLDRFKRFQAIAEHVDRKIAEVQKHNQDHQVDETELINGRRLTNIGTFRAYLLAYLRNHPQIHQGMTFLVRQLAPTPDGLPLEIYVFSKDKVWANYEAIQADIFDHVLAALPLFDLRVSQRPVGADLREALGARPGQTRAGST